MKKIFVAMLIKFGSVILKLYPKPDRAAYNLYLEYKLKLRKLYSKQLYWHGTGRYHYLNKDRVEDVLLKILKNNGLKPLVRDPWLRVGKKYKYTISLAKIRMYASVYAQIHQSSSGKGYYLFGSRLLWSFFIGLINLIQTPFDVMYHAYIFTFKKGREPLADFQSKVRKSERLKNLRTFILQLIYMPTIISDIKDNYSILIAVKRNRIKFIKLDSGFELYEARTEEPIHLNDISHIEIPSKYLKQTQDIFNNLDVKVQLIPLEAAEVFIKENYKLSEILTPPPSLLISEIGDINSKDHKEIWFPEIKLLLDIFKDKSTQHGLEHTLRVWIYTILLGLHYKEKVDINVLSAASLFHDVGRKTDFDLRVHGRNSGNWIMKNSSSIFNNFNQKQIKEIIELCRLHSEHVEEIENLELKILKDADGLDRWRLPTQKTNIKYLRLPLSRVLYTLSKELFTRWTNLDKKFSPIKKLIKISQEYDFFTILPNKLKIMRLNS